MQTIRIGLSPDPDDAFMLYALTAGKVTVAGAAIEPVLEDLESLNRRARRLAGGEAGADGLEVSALSAATYALVADRYRLLDAGAAMGKGYGPILVGREAVDPREIPERVVAIPGRHTTAALLFRIYCGDPAVIEVAFDRIPTAVLEGQADLGLLIHEGQLTHSSLGLVKVLDLAEAWQRDTGLPLPLGVNAVRRDLGEPLQRAVAQGLRDSIAWAHAHPEEALDHAMGHGRGMDRETCRRFVSMYVNDYAVSLGAEGRAALERLFAEAHRRKLIPALPPLDLL